MTAKVKRTTLIAKIEGTYGTDSTPTGTDDAVLFTNVRVTPLQMDAQARGQVRPFLGNGESLIAAKWLQLEVTCELAGAGAAGSAAPWGVLLRACGMGQTLNAGVSAVYAPISASEESISAYVNYDGTNHKSTGMRGTWSIRLNSRRNPEIVFSFTGLFVAVAAASLPSLTITAWQKPVPVNNTNTTFSLHSYSAIMNSFSVDANNETPYQNLVGTERVLLVDRDVKARCQIEAPAIGTKDYFSIATAGTLGAISVVHGTSAGNIVTIASSRVQLLGIGYADQDKIRMLDIDMGLTPSNSGNDEVTLTVT